MDPHGVAALADAEVVTVPISNDVPARTDTAAALVAAARSPRLRRRFSPLRDINTPLKI